MAVRHRLHPAYWIAPAVVALALSPVAAYADAPPGTAATCARPATRAAARYLLPTQFDALTLLPPPPAAGSDEQRQDLQAVLDAQRTARGAGTTQRAVEDAHLSCGRFADAVGAALTGDAAAAALAFLDRAAREGTAASGSVKRYYRRARPYAVSAQVERLADMAGPGRGPRGPAAGAPPGCAAPPAGVSPGPASGMQPGQPAFATAGGISGPQSQAAGRRDVGEEQAYSSYPSGHATFAAVCAVMLADMVPEKRREIFARESAYETSRMIVGAHFPSDLRAGRMVGTLAAAFMMQNTAFRQDLLQARAVLRTALGLPAQVPVAASAGAADAR